MSKQKHTPTPWKTQPVKGDEVGVCRRVNGTPYEFVTNCGTGWKGRDEANAEFIVKAVNSHDDMRKMLSLMVASHYCDDGCEICDKAKILIAKAKGEA